MRSVFPCSTFKPSVGISFQGKAKAPRKGMDFPKAVDNAFRPPVRRDSGSASADAIMRFRWSEQMYHRTPSSRSRSVQSVPHPGPAQGNFPRRGMVQSSTGRRGQGAGLLLPDRVLPSDRKVRHLFPHLDETQIN
jgi:hypothetical protein